MIIQGTVAGNVIEIDFEYSVNLDKLQGKKVELTLEKAQKTNAHHRYFYGVVCATFAQHIGIKNDQAARYLCNKFLTAEEDINNKLIFLTRSLSQLTKEEYFNFINKCESYLSAEYGVLLPVSEDYNSEINEFYAKNSNNF